VEFVAEFQEFPARELGPVVGDDGVWYSKTMDDVGEERHRLLYPEIRNWPYLDPLGKFVDCDQQVGEAPGRLPQGPDDVQPPYGERPCYGDGLQGVSRKVGFAGVELAPFAGAHDLAGIRDRGRPVKTLTERVAYEGAGCGVMAADPRVNIP
jgi:hypothetical protein